MRRLVVGCCCLAACAKPFDYRGGGLSVRFPDQASIEREGTPIMVTATSIVAQGHHLSVTHFEGRPLPTTRTPQQLIDACEGAAARAGAGVSTSLVVSCPSVPMILCETTFRGFRARALMAWTRESLVTVRATVPDGDFYRPEDKAFLSSVEVDGCRPFAR